MLRLRVAACVLAARALPLARTHRTDHTRSVAPGGGLAQVSSARSTDACMAAARNSARPLELRVAGAHAGRSSRVLAAHDIDSHAMSAALQWRGAEVRAHVCVVAAHARPPAAQSFGGPQPPTIHTRSSGHPGPAAHAARSCGCHPSGEAPALMGWARRAGARTVLVLAARWSSSWYSVCMASGVCPHSDTPARATPTPSWRVAPSR